MTVINWVSLSLPVTMQGIVTVIIVCQLHVEADAVGQRPQVLHQSVELPHQQDAGLLGVTAGHRHLVVSTDADKERRAGR